MDYIKKRFENKEYNFKKLQEELKVINCIPQCGKTENETSYIDVFYFENVESEKEITDIKRKMIEVVENHDPTPAPEVEPKSEMEELKELVDMLIMANLEVL